MKRCWAFTAACGALWAWAPAASAEVKPNATGEAAERFDRALRLVNVGDLSGGLAEFQRAYTLVPSSVVLYNLGLVYSALHRPVEAARSLTDALARSEALDSADVERARALLAEERERIGSVELNSNVSHGVVEVDNVEVAQLPLTAPLSVAAGPHVLGVVSPGFAPARKELIVAGRESVAVHLELVAIDGRLAHVAVRCRVPAAAVLVDGQRVGLTPLEKTVTVTPGAHRVEVKRPGYAPVSRSITLEDGASAELALEPLIDSSSLALEGGYLAVRASETQAVASIDGGPSALLRGALALPGGPHRLRVERGGFLAAERDVVVPLGKTLEVAVLLEPNPQTRADYAEKAQSRRTWSWLTVASGAAVAGGGLALALIENGKLPGRHRELDQAIAEGQRFSGGVCDPAREHGDDPAAHEASCAQHLAAAQSSVDSAKLGRTIGWVVTGVGSAAVVAGVVLILTGDDPHKYDRAPATRFVSSLRWARLPDSSGWIVSGGFSF